MSNPSDLPQLFISLDESLPELISSESDSFASESQQELADLFQQSSVASENLISATPGPTPLPVPNPSPTFSQVPTNPSPTSMNGFGDGIGDSMSMPYNLGPLNSSISFEQAVGSGDYLDVYAFTLNQQSNVHLTLNDLSGNADVGMTSAEYEKDPFGMGIPMNQKVIGMSLGSNGDQIIGQSLEAGTYYITVADGAFGANSSYALNLSLGF